MPLCGALSGLALNRGWEVFGVKDAYRAEYVRQTLEDEKGEVSVLESEVIESLKEQELLSKNIKIDELVISCHTRESGYPEFM